MSLVWDKSATAFLLLTLLIGGAGAWMSGRALARAWRPLGAVLPAVIALALAVRFFHFALANGQLLSMSGFASDGIYLVVVAALGWRSTRAGQMARQYPWLYRRTGPLTWAAVESPDGTSPR